MEQTQTLEVLICTINENIRKIPDVLIAERPDVKYLVSWQQTGTVTTPLELPEALNQRKDVKVEILEGRGLAPNRNNALKHATGDILLLSDDDTRYKDEYFDRILHNFRKYPKADFICFRAVDKDGNFLRQYATEPFTYSQRPKGTFFCSVEIAFRRKLSIPFFDERFGLGSKYLAGGEEEVFLHTAFQKGLKIIFVPETIVETDPNTTGKRFRTLASMRRTKGAVLCYIYGPMSAAARCLKFAMMQDCDLKTKWHYYQDMLAGIRYIRDGHIDK